VTSAPTEGAGRAESVDVGRIMEEVKARVAEKKAAGAYSAEEIEEISRMELKLRESEGYGEEMERLISWLHTHWEATGPVDSERQGKVSPGRDAAKKALRSLLGPLSRLLLGKQNQINARLVQVLSGSLPPLRDGSREVEERVDALALRLEEENRLLRQEVEKLAARLEEREEREGR
jgi:hypothetical protein